VATLLGVLYFRGCQKFAAYENLVRKGAKIGLSSPTRALFGHGLDDHLGAAFDTLWSLQFADNQRVTNDDVNAVEWFADLEEFNAARSTVSDRVAPMIGSMRRLNTVNFDDTSIGDLMMVELAKSAALSSISVRGTKITNGGLDALTVHRKVEFLYLDRTRVGDVGIHAVLQGLPHLKQLSLAKTLVSDSAFANARIPATLRSIVLDDNAIGDVSVEKLVQSKQIQYVFLDRTRVSDIGIKALTQCKSIRSISIVGTKVSDAGFDDLELLFELEYLDISETALTDTTIERLHRTTSLRELYLQGTNVTFEGVMRLSHLRDIEVLVVPIAAFDEEQQKAVRRGFPKAEVDFE
jgi:hypothetical protein